MTKSRRVGVVVVFLVGLVTAGHLYLGIREHGVSVAGVAPAMLGVVLVGLLFLAMTRWKKGRADTCSARKRWLAVGLVGLALSTFAEFMTSRLNEPQTRPDATFVLNGRSVVSRGLGLSLTFPEAWSKLDVPPAPGADVAMVLPSGVRFVAAAFAPAPGATVDATLQTMLDGKRKQYAVDAVQWGDEMLVGRPARTLAFTVQGPNGPVRMQVWIVSKLGYWANFHCGAPAGQFPRAAELCRDVLATLP